MKFITGNIFAVAVGVAAMQSAFAVPSLQLDSPQGTFDTATATTISHTDQFDIWALGKAPSGTYYLTAVVTPGVSSGDSSFGSFKIGSTTYDASNLIFGAPGNPVGTHGDFFPSYYAQISFTFGSDTVPSYDVQTDASASGTLARQVFAVDMSGLADGYGIHFDLFNTKLNNKGQTVIDQFAPFSHDAEGQRTNVPDGGATAALLGLGILGLTAISRKK